MATADEPLPYAALLRGVNVGGVRIAMAPLRRLVESLGHTEVGSLRASGNLVLRAAATDEATLADQLAGAIEGDLGRAVPVIVRSRDDLVAAAGTEPFGQDADPTLVHLVLLDGPLPPGAVDELRSRAAGAEQVAAAPRGLWIWYVDGSARSTLTLDVIERVTGRTGTARNLNTVRELVARLDRAGPDPR